MREDPSGAFVLSLGPPQQALRPHANPLQLPQLGGTCRPRAVHLGPIEVTTLTVVAGLDPQFV